MSFRSSLLRHHSPPRVPVECRIRHIACRKIIVVSNHPNDDHILPPEELPCSSLERPKKCKNFQLPTDGQLDNLKHPKTLGLQKMTEPADMKGVCWSSFWAFGGAPHKTKVKCRAYENASNKCSECCATLFLALEQIEQA